MIDIIRAKGVGDIGPGSDQHNSMEKGVGDNRKLFVFPFFAAHLYP